MTVKPKRCLGSELRLIVGLGTLSMPTPAWVADDRPASLAQAGGNPLALNAEAFLGWYWTLLLILVAVAVGVRLFGRGVRAPDRRSPELVEDPYAMAYLAGGPDRVMDAAIASLVDQGALRVNAVTRELTAERKPAPDRPGIERQVRGLLGSSRHIDDAARFRRRLQRGLRSSLTSLRDRLLRAGLLARPALQAKAAKPLVLGFVVLLGIGSIRLATGIAAGRAVGYLLISMVLTSVVAWWLLRRMGHERATAQGKQLLTEHRSRLGREDDDKLWLVAVLGLSGYGMGPMADLHHVMQMSVGNSLFQSRDRGRGDSSGGGGCGGGGGGCGGGGCGG